MTVHAGSLRGSAPSKSTANRLIKQHWKLPASNGNRLMIIEDRKGQMLVLTLDNAERRNALGMEMRIALQQIFERIEAEADIRAVVIKGAGAHFSAGADITGMNVTTATGARERFRISHKMVRGLVKSSKPIVAAVEGWCVGAGLSLALCCDTIVAASDSRFMASFGKVGLMGDLGLPGSVVEIADPAWQRDVWEVRKAGLNIMMSMKGDGKPVSFIEDCAVPLEHLAEYTDRLMRVFAKHGTRGTFYAHASVGCLHVRPVLNLRTENGARQMRAIAEEACALVKEYKGSYSGEHGDGLVRSEWIEPVYGPRLARAFAEIKRAFDPKGLMNPGKIVAASKMDDRGLFRFKPGYRTPALATGLDWSEHEVGAENRGRGFAAAVEMCNNNGHCRKFDTGTMCPSYRVTRDAS